MDDPQWKGFTPTRVGTAIGDACPTAQARVHPHASGDSSVGDRMPSKQEGSPPREWGQQQPPQLGDDVNRFTPTRVGTA